jgi:hypothetical protein
MRTYLELIEAQAEGAGGEADFIRIDVTGWSEADVEQAVSLLREHAGAYGSYVLQRHYCGHDSGAPCSVEILDVR